MLKESTNRVWITCQGEVRHAGDIEEAPGQPGWSLSGTVEDEGSVI
jgi:hypothetical protein